jgi:hypothetical protein
MKAGAAAGAAEGVVGVQPKKEPTEREEAAGEALVVQH